MGYSRVLAHYPYVILGTVSVFATTCLVVIVTIGEWPDFTEPRLGFEARGTEIGRRLLSYELLIENTEFNQIPSPQNFMARLGDSTRNNPSRNKSQRVYRSRLADDDDYYGNSYDEHGYHNTSTEEAFFCDVPRVEYARVVFQHTGDHTLFTRTSIQAMCVIEDQKLRTSPAFSNICVNKLSTRECCRSWSLGNYIALLSNKTSCLDISDKDVDSVYQRLRRCAPLYNNGSLSSLCGDHGDMDQPHHCRFLPPECKEHNAVYYILHYLTDMHFLRHKLVGLEKKLKYSLTFLPLAAGISTKQLYTDMEMQELQYNQVAIVGAHLGIKEDLFNHYLRKDCVWFAVSFLAIFISMWLYTASLFLTIMTIVSVFLSLEIAYFLYTMVYEIEFFPFKNLLAIVILLGIGADDVFIYSRVWTLAKLEKNAGTLEKIVSDTLKHATLSMFVTSFTTSAAFFANYVSSITALSCFALFAGTVVMVNFFLMVTWIPATIVIHEKWCSQCFTCYNPDFYTSDKRCAYYFCKVPHLVYSKICDWSRIFFEKILPCIVVRARYLWLFLLGLLGLGGIIVIFYFPKMKLPSSNDFQVFAQQHPFEVYDFQIKDQLWFEKAAGDSMAHMPMIIVWGVKAVDNGNRLDPYDEGTIEYDDEFNIAAPESQRWLSSFCLKLRSSEYYQLEHGLHVTNCFIDSFIKFMKRRCPRDSEDSPCCGNNEFPYEETVFTTCIQQWLPLLQQDNQYYTVNRKAGLRFSKDTGKLVGVVVNYLSKVPYSLNYDNMHNYNREVNQWVSEQMGTAPPGMKGGWFISDLEFYDLQNSIAQGTPIAIGISIAIASVVAFITTLNVFITIYAILSISFAIFVTVGALVLLGWELNILEAVTISVAVGLSIDFTLHYGVAYRLSPDLDREMRVMCGTGRMASPVAMAAFTTFLAGALMMPSTVLAYRQLGIFLMLVMSVSWVYATFFFQSLLRSVGPQGGFGQLHWPSSECCSGRNREHVDKTIYAMSESTLSSSSTNHVNSSETHELEPLTEQEPDMSSSHCTSSTATRGRCNQTPLSDYSTDSIVTMDTSTVANSTIAPSSNSTGQSEPLCPVSYHDNMIDADASVTLLATDTKSVVLDNNRNSCGSDVWVKQTALV